MVGNVLNMFMEHDLNILMIFGIKEKIYNFDPYNVLLVIATNILQRLSDSRLTYLYALHSYILYTTCIYSLHNVHKYKNLIESLWMKASVRCLEVNLLLFFSGVHRHLHRWDGSEDHRSGPVLLLSAGLETSLTVWSWVWVSWSWVCQRGGSVRPALLQTGNACSSCSFVLSL